MRTLLFLVCGLTFSLLNAGEPAALLSPAGADAIVEAQETAKAERKAARLAELNQAEVISEGETTLPDGRKVLVREVVPPAPVGTPLVADHEQSRMADVAPVTASQHEPTDEQQAWLKQQAQLQQHKVLMLSCTVYDRAITKVSWTYEGTRYSAICNADFNVLRAVMSVNSDTDRYDYFMAVGNASSEQTLELLPPLSAFSSERSEYVLTEGDPTNAAATAGLEALLAHYDSNLETLKIQHQRSVALTEARKRYKANNPEEPEDYLLQFWVPKPKDSGE